MTIPRQSWCRNPAPSSPHPFFIQLAATAFDPGRTLSRSEVRRRAKSRDIGSGRVDKLVDAGLLPTVKVAKYADLRIPEAAIEQILALPALTRDDVRDLNAVVIAAAGVQYPQDDSDIDRACYGCHTNMSRQALIMGSTAAWRTSKKSADSVERIICGIGGLAFLRDSVWDTVDFGPDDDGTHRFGWRPELADPDAAMTPVLLPLPTSWAGSVTYSDTNYTDR